MLESLFILDDLILIGDCSSGQYVGEF